MTGAAFTVVEACGCESDYDQYGVLILHATFRCRNGHEEPPVPRGGLYGMCRCSCACLKGIWREGRSWPTDRLCQWCAHGRHTEPEQGAVLAAG